MRKTAILVLAGISCQISFAHAEDSIGKCRAIDDPVQRLSCYDLASGRTATKVESEGEWALSTQKNPLDDTESAYAILESSSGKSRYSGPIGLMIRCVSNRSEAYFIWSTFLGSEMIRVTTRFDDAKATTATWGLSTDKKASFAPNAVDFMKKIAAAKTLVAQVTPYSESPITATFDLSGGGKAVDLISKTCKWKK